MLLLVSCMMRTRNHLLSFAGFMQGKPLIKQTTTHDKELCQVSKPFPSIYFVSHNHCHFIFLSVLVYLYDKITKRKEE